MKHLNTISRQPQKAVIGPGLDIVQQFFLFLSKGKILLPPKGA